MANGRQKKPIKLSGKQKINKNQETNEISAKNNSLAEKQKGW